MADIFFTGTGAMIADGAISLTSASVSYTGTGAIIAGGAIAGTVGNTILFTGTGAIIAGGAIAADRLIQFSGNGRMIADGSLTLTHNQAFTGTGAIIAGGRITADVDGQGLLVADIVASIMSLFGSCGCGQPEDECLQADIMAIINSMHQMIWSQAHRFDYFNRKTFTLSAGSGVASIALDNSIQNLLGPVRIADSGLPLKAISDRSEFENFISYFYGGSAPSTPRAYYLLSENQTSSDNVALSLLLTPSPAATVSLKVDASIEPPRYTWADAVVGTPLQIPHRYAEQLLIPLVKNWATSHRYFTRADLLPQIQQQYQSAQATLGMVDSNTPEKVQASNSKPA